MIRRTLILGVLALILTGCAHDRDWLIRQPGVESTIGNDPNKFPPGKVIPPPGMGVDLGDGSRDVSGRSEFDSLMLISGLAVQRS